MKTKKLQKRVVVKVKTKKTVRVLVPSFEVMKTKIDGLTKPVYERLKKAEYTKAPRFLGAGAKRVLRAFLAGRFKKSGILNTLEIPEIRGSVNNSDRRILTALNVLTGNNSVDVVEVSPDSKINRKAYKIRIK